LIKRRWKQKEQVLFLKRLGLLLEKGYSLNEAIDFIKIQLDQPKQVLLNESMERLNRELLFCFRTIRVSSNSS
jgi:competence protein ComGB